MCFLKTGFYGIVILFGCDSKEIRPPSPMEVAAEGRRKELFILIS